MAKITEDTIKKLPVKFGRFSSGDETCSLTVKLDREVFTAACGDSPALVRMAVEYICCGTQCDAELIWDPNAVNDVPGQTKLTGMDVDRVEFEGIAKIPGIHVTRRAIRFSMQFELAAIEHEALLKMSCREGVLTLRRRGPLKDEDGDESNADEE